METTKSVRLEKLKDPRQSPAWGKMLKYYGWRLHYTTSGVMVPVMKLPLIGSLIKVQRVSNLTDKDFAEIDEIGKKTRALFVRIDPFIYQDESLFKKYGYEQSTFPLCPTKTMFINLELDSDELWDKVSHSGKYSINRARREGAKLYFYRNPTKEKMMEYYKVLAATGKRKHFYVEPFRFNLYKKECFAGESFLIMVYGKNGQIEGGKFFVAYEGNVLYVTGGTTEQGRKSKSGYLLTWEALLYFKRLGYKSLDLEGLHDNRFPSFTSGWEGFSHFKDKFNGDIVELPAPQVKYLSPILKAMAKVSPAAM